MNLKIKGLPLLLNQMFQSPNGGLVIVFVNSQSFYSCRERRRKNSKDLKFPFSKNVTYSFEWLFFSSFLVMGISKKIGKFKCEKELLRLPVEAFRFCSCNNFFLL